MVPCPLSQCARQSHAINDNLAMYLLYLLLPIAICQYMQLTDSLAIRVLVVFTSNRDMPSHVCIALHCIVVNKQESSRAELNPQEC